MYDFSTADGYYAIGFDSASSVAVHNCGITPVSKFEFADLSKRGVRVESNW